MQLIDYPLSIPIINRRGKPNVVGQGLESQHSRCRRRRMESYGPAQAAQRDSISKPKGLGCHSVVEYLHNMYKTVNPPALHIHGLFKPLSIFGTGLPLIQNTTSHPQIKYKETFKAKSLSSLQLYIIVAQKHAHQIIWLSLKGKNGYLSFEQTPFCCQLAGNKLRR